jgi:hypothetical protein
MSASKELARIGDIIDADIDPRQDRIDDLERQVAKLRGDLSDARHELTRVRENANRALKPLRQQLSPLYRALQRVFGELDDAGVPDVPFGAPSSVATSNTSGTVDARTAVIWDSWKSKLGPQCAAVIDALLVHPNLNTTQLAIAVGKNRNTIPNLIYKLNQAGLIDKNGGRFSLKQL